MIRVLPYNLVNQIAAGEVIERPSAVVKELVENSLDAGADSIFIDIEDGGRSLIRITDNGKGMNREELPLAILRHATSKLPHDDLFNISTNGFRGEALPSIGAVSKLSITSKAQGCDDAWMITVEGGDISEIQPAVINQGTCLEVRDLFYATPARLNFLKSERSETSAIKEIITRLAIVHPESAFVLKDESRTLLNYTASQGDLLESHRARLRQVFGGDVTENLLPVDAEREGIRLTGFTGVPTLNKGTSAQQYFYVNGRAIKDKQLMGLARVAYQDFLARDRHPIFALFIDVPPSFVDVNVHPTKFEVRFRDPALVRGLIIGALKDVLQTAGHQASTTVSKTALGAFTPSTTQYTPQQSRASYPSAHNYAPQQSLAGLSEPSANSYKPRFQPNPMPMQTAEAPVAEEMPDYPLGAACAQVHETYVVSQTADSLVLVDQHAAHERLVYEQMKAGLQAGNIKRQGLLIPDVVELTEDQATLVVERAVELEELGLVIETFGKTAIMVRETPALLGHTDSKKLIEDLAEQLQNLDGHTALKDKLEEVCSSMACRGSVRSGRRLNPDEMNSLLREMEQTPHSGQCNHGRPTYVELKLKDIEKLFGRR